MSKFADVPCPDCGALCLWVRRNESGEVYWLLRCNACTRQATADPVRFPTVAPALAWLAAD